MLNRLHPWIAVLVQEYVSKHYDRQQRLLHHRLTPLILNNLLSLTTILASRVLSAEHRKGLVVTA